MATFQSGQRADITQKCPYNPNHKLAPRRYAKHILTCPDRVRKDMAPCQFNYGHVLPRQELNQHYMVCPDAKKAIRDMVEEETNAQNSKKPARCAVPELNQGATSANGPKEDDWSYTEGDEINDQLCKLRANGATQNWRQTCFRDGQINPLGTMGVSSLSKGDKAEYHEMLLNKAKERQREVEQEELQSEAVAGTSVVNAKPFAVKVEKINMEDDGLLARIPRLPPPELSDAPVTPKRCGFGRGALYYK